MSQQKHSFEAQITKTVRLNYLLHLPTNYGQDMAKRWPLILFLHGAGERGSDLELVKKHGIPKVVEQRPDFPFIAVSPQCPADSWWNFHFDALEGLLDQVASQYAVDRSRVYCTGLSMGGFGTWHLAIERPGRFAAIAPICGGLMWYLRPESVCTLKNLPVWAFHGAKDEVVPLESSQRLVDALKACGGNVRFTVYPEAGHDSWTETYNNPELYTWFLQHSLVR